MRIANNIEIFGNKCKEKFQNNFSYPYINTEYKNSHSKITIHCNTCGTDFIKIANDHWNSIYGGCPKCKNKRFEVLKMISFDGLHKLYDKVNIIPYLGLKDKNQDSVEITCPIHGIVRQKIKNLVNDEECPKCRQLKGSKSKLLSKDEIDLRLKEICKDNLDYDLVEYKNTTTKIKLTCKKCGNIFYRDFNALLYNSKCPKCRKEETIVEKTKTTEDFINECKEKYGDAFDYTNTIYTKSSEKINVKCNECGRTFSIEANSHLQGHGCPYHFINKSKAEIEIYNFLKEILPDTEIIQNYRENKEIKELDIYIPSKQFAIEYNGLFWHSELEKDKNYHLNKTNACLRLFHIFEDEWSNKREIVKSMLINILAKNSTRIYARKCELKMVQPHEARIFLENNHLQGKCGATYHYGLYYNNELVSLMTFGKTRHFVGKSSENFELLRFCNKLNTDVVGGASKLLKHFINDIKPKAIISYADKRWSIGNLYEKLGFEKYNESKPNYYYIINGNRIYRYNLRKSVLIKRYNCPSNMTEKEFCKQQKWYRIYDCGCLCYKKTC